MSPTLRERVSPVNTAAGLGGLPQTAALRSLLNEEPPAEALEEEKLGQPRRAACGLERHYFYGPAGWSQTKNQLRPSGDDPRASNDAACRITD
jgi:hypothetical protein